MTNSIDHTTGGRDVRVPIDGLTLDGDLVVPTGATGLVLFAHGSGSSRHSPRNRAVARALQLHGLATLLFDLLTPAEEREDEITRELRFDIPLLAARLAGATDWITHRSPGRRLPVGYFGASTGAAAALVAAAARAHVVRAVVSRGGRPDLAGPALDTVRAPTLLIVGGRDAPVLALNRQALRRLQAPKRLVEIPGATHLFEEPGALTAVAELAADWFARHLRPPSPSPERSGGGW